MPVREDDSFVNGIVLVTDIFKNILNVFILTITV